MVKHIFEDQEFEGLEVRVLSVEKKESLLIEKHSKNSYGGQEDGKAVTNVRAGVCQRPA